jgi:hypothetical protein
MNWLLSTGLILAGILIILTRVRASRISAQQQLKYFGGGDPEPYETLARILSVSVGLVFAGAGVILLVLQWKAGTGR